MLEWTPAGMLMNFKGRITAGFEFFTKSRSRHETGVIFCIAFGVQIGV